MTTKSQWDWRTGFLLDEELEREVLHLAVGTRRTQAVLRVPVDDGLERGTKNRW
jgi:hypothetical protein